MSWLDNTLNHQRNVENNIQKSFGSGFDMNEELEKARHGVYSDNATNRKLNRVGQEYGNAAKTKESAQKNSSSNNDDQQKSHQKMASEASDKALKRASEDENADPKIRDIAKKELDKRGEQTNVNKENYKELSQARSTLKQMIDDEDLAYKFLTWDRGLYDESEVSKDEEAAFENLTKNINWNYGKYFDWEDAEEADEYKMKMERKGFTVIDGGAGSDSFIFILFKPKKNKK